MSPVSAPVMMAPAVTPTGMPRLMPTPMKATPMVPTVVKDEPVSRPMTKHTSMAQTRNHLADMIFRP